MDGRQLRSPAETPPPPPRQNDIGSGLPELQVMALSFLPHLPPQMLVDMLERGARGRSRPRPRQGRGRLGTGLQRGGLRSHPLGPHPTHPFCCPTPAGEIAALVEPFTRNVAPSVRAAATASLGALLLQHDVQAALAASPCEPLAWLTPAAGALGGPRIVPGKPAAARAPPPPAAQRGPHPRLPPRPVPPQPWWRPATSGGTP
jgi:hypothetical protein